MIKLDKLQFAYVSENDIRNIKGANKNEKYFLDKYLTIPLVYCKGEKVVDYWRKEKSIDNKIVKDYFKNSESIEHYNKKMEIYFSQEFRTKDCIFIGSDAQAEYRIKDKIIDVVLFDDNKKPLVGIEVYCTNKKTEEDIKKLEKLNFPIYEYNTETGKSYPLCCGVTETDKGKYFKEEIHKINEKVSRDKIRIDKGREFLQTQYKDIGILEHVTEKWWIENEIKELEERIRAIETKGGESKESAEEITRLEMEIRNSEREFGKVEKQVREIEEDGQAAVADYNDKILNMDLQYNFKL